MQEGERERETDVEMLSNVHHTWIRDASRQMKIKSHREWVSEKKSVRWLQGNLPYKRIALERWCQFLDVIRIIALRDWNGRGAYICD